MDKQRVLTTVKTYPTLSRKYGETVCTAGLREDGSWVRMYPVPFRRLDEAEQTFVGFALPFVIVTRSPVRDTG